MKSERGDGGIGEVSINRKTGVPTYPFTEVFKGFEKVDAVKEIFGKSTKRTLNNLRVSLYRSRRGGYMWIDDKAGCIVCNLDYLRSASKTYIYLDVIHELVHIKQLHAGRALFDSRYHYLDRPTELEAYRVAIDEARRTGMGKKELTEYLKVEWVTKKEFARFLGRFGLR